MKKILVVLLLMLGMSALADERPPYIQSLENQIAAERDRDRAAVLMREYESFFRSYLNSIKGSESSIFFLGDQYFRIRKYERAAQIFSSNTSSARNLFGAATCYRFIGEYDKAVDFYSVAISESPSMREAYLGRGLAYRNVGNYDRAIQDIQRYLQLGSSPAGYIALGDIYLAQKNIDKARAILQEGRRLYPDSQGINDVLKATYLK